jgi:hypothetical protein
LTWAMGSTMLRRPRREGEGPREGARSRPGPGHLGAREGVDRVDKVESIHLRSC